MEHRRIILALAVTLMIAQLAYATTTTIPQFKDTPEGRQLFELIAGVKTVASALGLLVLVYAGLTWIFMAENPQERDDAKKTIIYVIVGLLVVSMAEQIVNAVYCYTLQNVKPPSSGGSSYGEGVC